MKNKIFLAVLYLAIALTPACGSRKVGLDINKTNSSDQSKQSTDSDNQSQSRSNETNDSSTNNDKIDDVREEVEVTNYDTAGRKSSVTKSVKQSKSIDKSVLVTKSVKTNNLRTIEKLRTLTITKHEQASYSKKKDTEASNSQWVWAVGIVAGIAVLCYFGIKALRG